MVETGKKAFVATLVAVAVVVSALALWKLKLIISLLFLAVIIAAAMQPGIDALRRRRVPRGVGILVHYAGLFGVVALLLWLVVPRARDQISEAIGNLPTALPRFQSLVADFDSNLGNYDTLKPVSFVPIIWTTMGLGLLTLIGGSVALLWPRHKLYFVL